MNTDELYAKLPIWAQNLALSVYGLQLRSRRYGGLHKKFYASLLTSDFASADTVNVLQQRLLVEQLDFARSNVSHYRDHLPAAMRGNVLDSLADLPVLSKDFLKANQSEWVLSVQPNDIVINTSGSTGSPLRIVVNSRAVQRNYSFFRRFLHWHGVSPFDRSATFAGRLFLPRDTAKAPFWRYNHAMNDTLFSSYHLSNSNLPAYIREMERINPVFIDSYPSSIAKVAAFIVQERIKHSIRPKVIVTSSETLLPQQRALVEAAFGCKVADQYGSAEMAGFAAQCTYGTYHVAPEYGIFEVLDADNKRVADGTIGALCLTGFLNSRMPFIRYLIGDVGAISQSTCACGRHGQVLLSIEGRMDDVLVTPSGRHVGRLDPAFKGVEGVVESQIIQVSHDELRVLIVPDQSGNFDPKLLESNLYDRVGRDMSIEIYTVAQINKEPNGKFRAVKNLVGRS